MPQFCAQSQTKPELKYQSSWFIALYICNRTQSSHVYFPHLTGKNKGRMSFLDYFLIIDNFLCNSLKIYFGNSLTMTPWHLTLEAVQKDCIKSAVSLYDFTVGSGNRVWTITRYILNMHGLVFGFYPVPLTTGPWWALKFCKQCNNKHGKRKEST